MAIILLILGFIASLVPGILIYLWLRKRKPEDLQYKDICKSALKRGLFLCTGLVFVLSSIFYIIEMVIKLLGAGELVIDVYHKFIVFALAEELVKYYVTMNLMKKKPYQYSRLDVISLMMIVALGFGFLEAVVYAVGANIPTMLVRGFTAMHCGYGFIMGCFVSKGMQTGKKSYTLLGLGIPFLLHGLYDCCLSESLWAVNENFAYVSLGLAIFAIFTLIFAIVFIRKASGKPEYTEPLRAAN